MDRTERIARKIVGKVDESTFNELNYEYEQVFNQYRDFVNKLKKVIVKSDFSDLKGFLKTLKEIEKEDSKLNKKIFKNIGTNPEVKPVFEDEMRLHSNISKGISWLERSISDIEQVKEMLNNIASMK